MKRTIPAAILSLLAVFASAQLKPVITVLDFKTSGVSEREMKSIISLISNTLFKTGKFTVIDVTQRELLLKEIEFSMSDCVEETCQIEIGKQLSAELIVVGSIDQVGNSLILASKILETKSAKTVSVADGVYPDLNQLVKDIGKLGSELAGTSTTIGQSISRTATVPSTAKGRDFRVPEGYVLVDTGTFLMGSTGGDAHEAPTHSVTISRSFFMDRYEVIQRKWRVVMGKNPSLFKGDTLPVENVNWYNALEYCNRLSRKEGLTPCYSGSGDSIVCDFSANGYRLPTEAEWAYAAGGGNQGRGFAYPGGNSPGDVGWYSANSDRRTHSVGQKQPNELGLYDMSGNVWEWCWDWYGPYSAAPATDPRGVQSGSRRVVRGGSYGSELGTPGGLRSADRDNSSPSDIFCSLGFRLVRMAE